MVPGSEACKPKPPKPSSPLASVCTVRVPLLDGLDRILAEDLLADRAVPPADNSAMDGYALRCADWPAEG